MERTERAEFSHIPIWFVSGSIASLVASLTLEFRLFSGFNIARRCGVIVLALLQLVIISFGCFMIYAEFS